MGNGGVEEWRSGGVGERVLNFEFSFSPCPPLSPSPPLKNSPHLPIPPSPHLSMPHAHCPMPYTP
ncbi:hypothetical protein [Tolypothrix sp. VBCCA 56010]|uniref:hypothetical protein n=1 Tax=Tolypothrix sp. VBCCA 56010 TaxID=3137731 RepID=UPI003D7F0F75